ncbi:cytochrome P450 [Streptomyces sp. NBC_01210]|uniref:cytochrome P450 family protein n=1 Tax=Streptomyces sp. NBC_01210 TaxID=2903774 RepID=UPI002E0FB0F4|nr:cytochrome P450 [Streptomyces sp. NBC_01210]
MTLVELVPDQARFTTDPHSRYAQLRAQGAVHHVLLPSKEAAWLVTDAAAVRAALADERLRNDIRHSASWTHDGGYAIGRNLLQVDPPDHPRLRRLVAGEFTRHRIQALRQRVQDIADGLVDAMAPAGRADLVDAYAFPLPVTVICELLGVPGADRDTFRAWSAEIVAATNHETASAAASAMTGYLTDLIETKRSQPLAAHTEADGSAKGDLLHALAHANSTQEEPLTPPELLGMAFLLLVAGHETTANLIASTVHLLLRHPAQLAALQADWTLLEGTVEEAMRYEPPALATTYRYPVEPVTIAGTTIPKGAPVILGLAAANRDPALFPDPDRFDIHRDPANTRTHLSFGHGIHHCLGAPLARLEAAIAVRTLLEHLPHLAPADPSTPPEWRPSLLRGLHRLPVTW